MINAIGLENQERRRSSRGSPLGAAAAAVIVSVGGNTPDEFAAVVRLIERHSSAAAPGEAPRIEGYELNVSCPNVDRTADRRRSGGDGGRRRRGARRDRSLPAGRAHPERERRDRAGPRGRRGGRRWTLPGEHLQGHGARPADPAPVPRQSHRGPLRTGDQTHRLTNGRRGGDGVARRAHRRHGRRDVRARRPRVHRLRGLSGGRRRRQLRAASRSRRASSPSCAPSLPRAASRLRPPRAASRLSAWRSGGLWAPPKTPASGAFCRRAAIELLGNRIDSLAMSTTARQFNSAPERSLDQRLDALARANQIRSLGQLSRQTSSAVTRTSATCSSRLRTSCSRPR